MNMVPEKTIEECKRATLMSVRHCWSALLCPSIAKPYDVRELKSLAKQKIGVKKIAKALKRTPGATGGKAAKLGVSLDTRG